MAMKWLVHGYLIVVYLFIFGGGVQNRSCPEQNGNILGKNGGTIDKDSD